MGSNIEKGFVTMKVKRTMEGLTLTAYSPTLHQLFRAFAESQNYSQLEREFSSGGWGLPGPLKYLNNNENFPFSDKGGAWYELGQDNYPLFYRSFPNFSLFRLHRVAEEGGVTLKLSGVFSKETLEAFQTKSKAALIWLYQNYLKKVEFELVLTTQEIY